MGNAPTNCCTHASRHRRAARTRPDAPHAAGLSAGAKRAGGDRAKGTPRNLSALAVAPVSEVVVPASAPASMEMVGVARSSHDPGAFAVSGARAPVAVAGEACAVPDPRSMVRKARSGMVRCGPPERLVA
jgi:hypothetical protein